MIKNKIIVFITIICISSVLGLIINNKISANGNSNVNIQINSQAIVKSGREHLESLEKLDVNNIENKIKEVNENKFKEETLVENDQIDLKKYYKNTVFMGDSLTEFIGSEGILNDKSVVANKGRDVILAKNDIEKLKILNPKRHQFPMRTLWIKLKSNLELSVGKNESNDVFVCKDKYLIEDYKGEPLEETNEKVNTINKFANKYQKLNVSFMLVPTATKIWEDKLRKYASVDDQVKFISNFKSKLDEKIKFIDTYDTLNNNKSEYIYYKTDHDWTSRGAYLSYKEMCKTLNLKVKEEVEFDVEPVTNNFYGSLYYKKCKYI